MFVKHIYDLYFDSCLVLRDLLLVIGDNLLELVHVGPKELSHLGLVLHEDEGGHFDDVVLSRDVLAIINVNLKYHFCVRSFK